MYGNRFLAKAFGNYHTIPYKYGYKAGSWFGKRYYGKTRTGYRRSTYAARYRGGGYNPYKELKFHDLQIDDAIIATAGTIIAPSCNLIVQGALDNARIGRKCTIKQINWRIVLRKNAAQTTIGDDVARLILYVDKQANGAAAAVLDILETAHYQSHYNLANQGRFRILMDNTVALNSTAGGGDGTTDEAYSKSISKQFIKRCSIALEFANTSGAITGITSNNIGVLTISRDGTSQLESNIRLKFVG